MFDFLLDPTLRHALIGAILVSIGSAPLGVFLVLRRMSLMGDVMAHAILPGVAGAFILCGMSIPVMSLGGLTAGLAVALLAGLVSRITVLREDASLAAFYLIAVAAGVMMIAMHGNAQDLEEILFGNAQAVTQQMLAVMVGITLFTLVLLAVIYRLLVVESFDPVFLRSVGAKGGLVHAAFLALTVLNMVMSYRTMGTLMSAGLMLIPAIAAQFWTQNLRMMLAVSVGVGIAGAVAGLALSYAWHAPSGPAIVLVTGGIYILSLLFGRFGSVRARYFPFKHLKA